MPKIQYESKTFSQKSDARIQIANNIIDEYQAAGFDLTLRQLYYQFVSRGLLENTERSYKNLGALIGDARMAGLIDWDAIGDRTRFIRELPHWDSPREIVQACGQQYRRELWRTQPTRVEVWIEKDALVGVFEPTCQELHVPLFSCRGYTSLSEMWSASQRLIGYAEDHDQDIHVLHFGDHDPSGIDMTRDIEDRLRTFTENDLGGRVLTIERVALTMRQVQEYDPPPNPAKVTDSRFEAYEREHGSESWELDALEPRVLADLVREHVEQHRDADLWEEAEEQQEKERKVIKAAATKMGAKE